MKDPRKTGMKGLKATFGAFVTGLAFVAPVLLTFIVLAWVFSQLVGFVGPDSLFGQALTAAGSLFTGRNASPLLGFLIGVGLLIVGITALGTVVRTRATQFLEDAVDGIIGRIPLLGGIYRPVAQLVRGMGGDKSEQMATMSVCRVMFGGGVESIAFLASPETFDIGGGPAKLVLIPTAPVPIGGALLLVAADKVQVIPSMKFDDLAKLYFTMGLSPPPQLRASEQVVPDVAHPVG